MLVLILSLSCSHGIKDSALKQIAKTSSINKVRTPVNFIGHWLYQAKKEDLVREIANEFEFLNQDCSVNLQFPEDVYYDRSKANCEEEFVKTQLLSDHPKFDILRINDQYLNIAFYMKDMDWPKKYLVDFSQYPQFISSTNPDLVNDSAKAKWKGIIPGPYLEGYNYSIWYNQELAKELGLEIKQFGMTFEDCLLT